MWYFWLYCEGFWIKCLKCRCLYLPCELNKPYSSFVRIVLKKTTTFQCRIAIQWGLAIDPNCESVAAWRLCGLCILVVLIPFSLLTSAVTRLRISVFYFPWFTFLHYKNWKGKIAVACQGNSFPKFSLWSYKMNSRTVFKFQLFIVKILRMPSVLGR